jgi:hypothetical protein
MTTRNVDLVPSEYRLITDEDNFLVHNASDSNIYFVFADSLPAFRSIKPHPLISGEALVRNGLSGNVYGYSHDSAATIPVSE